MENPVFVNNFDGKSLTRAVMKAQKKVLLHQGAILRRNVSQLLRFKKSPSKPGQPPRSVTGALKQGIRYDYDSRTDSVFVGPIKYENSQAARTLEHGGTVEIPKVWQKPRFGVGLPAGKGGTGPVLLTDHDTAPDKDWSVPWGIGEHDPKIPKLSAGWSQTIFVVWRHLRTEKEVALAERNYQKMLALRGTVPTTKKVGKVEPRPFMSSALEKSRAKLVELWKEAIF